jgi:alpha-L-arabinofuranosidase B-like protein
MTRFYSTLFFLSLITQIRAQNTLDKAGLGSGTPASAAYSTRLLSSTYAGKALMVRRSSDNAQSDIGFTASGDLDTASLKTFVGAGDAFVTALYDQSGNGLDLTQATAANQPQLVSSGAIYRENGQPFIRFFGSGTSYNSLNLAADMTTVGHVSAVIRLMSAGDGFILSHTSDYYWHSNPPTNLFNTTFSSASVQGGNGWYNGEPFPPTQLPYPSTLALTEAEPSTPSTGTTWNNIGSDRNQYHDISLGGGYGELVLFPNALSTADRQALETNQKGYFTISVLPVTWLSFTAQEQKAGVLLKWQTATEQNSKDFTVRYSTNGETWTNLATLPAAGNSTAASSYKYVHSSPVPGDNYYRIAETDLDGKTTYSDINTIHIAPAQTEFQVLQNPAVGGILRVRVNTPTTLSLYSMDGKLLQRTQSPQGTLLLPLDAYPKGTYLLTGRTTTVQVLVQ